jgi:hypothetical protein
MLEKIFSKLKSMQLAIWVDINESQLKFEAHTLEHIHNTHVNEKMGLEKLLADFQYQHIKELGNIILKILITKKLKYNKSTTEFEEAQKDFNEYSGQIENEKKIDKYDLTQEEKIELKKNFRNASKLCHPDIVSNELKDKANEVFGNLKIAYGMNDLIKVNEILVNLQTGNFFISNSDTYTEKEKLKSLIEKLKKQIAELEEEINWIKNSETYLTINAIDNWETYFVKTRENLQIELDQLNTMNNV